MVYEDEGTSTTDGQHASSHRITYTGSFCFILFGFCFVLFCFFDSPSRSEELHHKQTTKLPWSESEAVASKMSMQQAQAGVEKSSFLALITK